MYESKQMYEVVTYIYITMKVCLRNKIGKLNISDLLAYNAENNITE